MKNSSLCSLQILAKSQPSLQWREVKRLGELQTQLGLSLDGMLELIKTNLHKEPYSKAEVCKILEISPEELAETSLSANTRDGMWMSPHLSS